MITNFSLFFALNFNFMIKIHLNFHLFDNFFYASSIFYFYVSIFFGYRFSILICFSFFFFIFISFFSYHYCDFRCSRFFIFSFVNLLLLLQSVLQYLLIFEHLNFIVLLYWMLPFPSQIVIFLFFCFISLFFYNMVLQIHVKCYCCYRFSLKYHELNYIKCSTHINLKFQHISIQSLQN